MNMLETTYPITAEQVDAVVRGKMKVRRGTYHAKNFRKLAPTALADYEGAIPQGFLITRAQTAWNAWYLRCAARPSVPPIRAFLFKKYARILVDFLPVYPIRYHPEMYSELFALFCYTAVRQTWIYSGEISGCDRIPIERVAEIGQRILSIIKASRLETGACGGGAIE